MPIDSVTLSDAYDPGERAPAKTHLGGLINEYTAARLKHGTASKGLHGVVVAGIGSALGWAL